MTIQFSKQSMAVLSDGLPKMRSGLVCRLVCARDDPGKERIRMWLIDLDDAQLQSGLGLTVEDIAVLRTGTCKAWRAEAQDSGCPHQPLCRNRRALAARSRGYRWCAACEGRERLTSRHSRGASFKMSITLTAREARPAGGLILLTMSLGVLIAQIDTSVVNLAVKPIGTDLKASVTELQWIVDGYNFVYASLLLTAGTLADLYGRRRIFARGIGLFTLGTVVCLLAPDVPTLVAGRAVAGLGAALEVPASLAILTIAYPDTKERTRALGIWASCYGIAIVIGPTAGGALVDASGWRSIFLLIIPFCLVTLVLVMTVVPESSNPQGRRLD